MSASRATQWTQLFLVLEEPPRNAGELLARLRQLGLRDITHCRLTRNRTVMVSYSDVELRVHEGFLGAPDHVLAAIVEFVQGHTRGARLRARRTLISFPIAAHGSFRRRASGHPSDASAAQRLAEWHTRYNAEFFGGALRTIGMRVSRRMRARLGHYTAATPAGDPPEIAISRRHLRRDGWNEALQTLLHEMVHQWQDENGLALDHSATFRAKAREIGIAPFACRTVAA